MAKLIGELLFEIIGALVRGLVYSLWVKFVTWLDPKVHGRAAKIVVGMIMGLGLFFLMPTVSGLLSRLL